MHWLRRLLCLVFGGVFIYSGLLKLRDPGLFLIDIRGFDILPDPLAAWLALVLPWVELIGGLAVMTGIFRSGGVLLLNLSLIVFMAVIGYAQYRGLDIKCGCFGASNEISSYLELYLRDALLLGMGIAIMFGQRSLIKRP